MPIAVGARPQKAVSTSCPYFPQQDRQHVGSIRIIINHKDPARGTGTLNAAAASAGAASGAVHEKVWVVG